MQRLRMGPSPDPSPEVGPEASPCPDAVADEEVGVVSDSFATMVVVVVPFSDVALVAAVVDDDDDAARGDVVVVAGLKGCVVKRTRTSSAAVTVVDGLPERCSKREGREEEVDYVKKDF